MPVHSLAALAIFQSGSMEHDVHLLTIFAGAITIALVLLALGLAISGVFMAWLLYTVNGLVKEAKVHTGPLLEKTNQMVQELAPKVHAMTENAEQMSYTVRAKLDEIGETVSQINRTAQDVNNRTRTHVAHADGIVTDALNAAENISRTVEQGIRGPVRAVAGILAGVKAGLEKLVELSPFGRD